MFFLVVLNAKARVRAVPAWLQPQAPRPELPKGSRETSAMHSVSRERVGLCGLLQPLAL